MAIFNLYMRKYTKAKNKMFAIYETKECACMKCTIAHMYKYVIYVKLSF